MFCSRLALSSSVVDPRVSSVLGSYLHLVLAVSVPGGPIVGWLLLSLSSREDFCFSGRSLSGKQFLFQENPTLWEKPVLLVLIEVGRHFSLFVLYRSSGDFYVGKTRLGKNLRVAGRSRLLWRVLALLAICSLPVFGRLLLLPSVGVRKNSS